MRTRGAAFRRIYRTATFAFEVDRARAVGVLLLAVVTGLAPALTAWATKLIVDSVARVHQVLLPQAVLFLGASAIVLLGPTVSQLLQQDLARSVTVRTRERTFERVNAFGGLRYFEDPTFHDDLEMAVNAGDHTPTTALTTLTGLAQTAMTTIGFAVALCVVDWRLLVLVAIAGLPRFFLETRLGRARFEMQARLTPTMRLEFYYGQLQTDPGPAKEVRLFGLGSFLKQRMVGQLRRANRHSHDLDVRTARMSTLLDFGGLLPVAVALLFIVSRLYDGSVGPGDLMLLLAAIAALQGSVSQLSDSVGKLNELSLTITRYDRVLEMPADVKRGSGADVAPLEVLELRDVWFRYRDDLPWVLRGVSLRIDAGQAVAIVGANGAGKSTLLKLLGRLYDPQHGSICWNGRNIRELEVDQLRARCGFVFQDFVSYELTVRENVAVGDLACREDDQRLWQALREVDLDTLVAQYPDGLDTQLSRSFRIDADQDDHDAVGGTYLSGGQWQRLAVARMMLRADRDLLVLDEPSAGLDPMAEYTLNTLVRHRTRSATRLLVSHRLNTVRPADRIVVIEDGVVREQGTHDELVVQAGVYARLFTLQRRGFEDLVTLTETQNQPVL